MLLDFLNSTNITDSIYRGEWVGRGGMGVEGGWEAEGRSYVPSISTETELLCF